jgi:hypothetical protein
MIFEEVFLGEGENKKERQKVFKAPDPGMVPRNNSISLFLAGSIEMGKAKDWQTELTDELLEAYSNIYIFNPRRDDWDSSWEQKKENKQFNEQVTWELSHIEFADFIVVYFDEKTQSPITLAELGLIAGKFPQKAIVYCPEKFFRKGNVDIICDRYGLTQIDNIEDFKAALEKKTKFLKKKVG